MAMLGDGSRPETILDRLEKDPSPRVRRAAAEAVRILRLPVLPTRLTLPLEKDPDPYVRAECARAIGATGIRPGAPALLARLVNDNAAEVRAVAAEALSSLQAAEALPLFRFLASNDPSPLVRIFATRSLADARDPDSQALFRETWDSTRDAELRIEAFRGLLRSGAPGDWISAGLSDGDDRVRFLAFEQWLSGAAGRDAAPPRRSEVVLRLEAFLGDPLPGIRDLARRELEARGFHVRPSGLKLVIDD